MPTDAQLDSSPIGKKARKKKRKSKAKAEAGAGAAAATTSSKASSRAKKVAKSKKKRRRDSPSSPDTSPSSSSPSDYSSDSDSRGRQKKRLRWQHSPKRASGSVPRRKKESARGRRKQKGRSRHSKDASVSSSSDGYSSRSCSTCSGRSSSPEDTRARERKSKKGRSDWRRKEEKSEPRSRIKRRHSGQSRRSPSSSSCSEFSGGRRCSRGDRSHSRDEERLAGKHRSTGHSPSAVACATGPKELGSRGGGYKDNKEEVIQDYADFTSSRRNDSCEGVEKRERRGTLVEQVGGGARTERNDSSEASARPIDTVTGGEIQWQCGNDSLLNEPRRDEYPPRLKSVVVVPARSPEADDLELLLRQKALENLKKFKHVNSSKVDSFGDPKHILTQKDKNESAESDMGNREEKHVEKKSTNAMEIDQCPQAQNRGKSMTNLSTKIAPLPTPREQSNRSQDWQEQSNGTQNGNRPGTTATPMPVKSSIDNHHKSQKNQLLREQEDSNKNLMKLPSATNRAPDSVKTIGNVDKTGSNNSVASASGSSTVRDQKAGLHIANEQRDQAKIDPELEKKTMTVMRGGELVQVSYNVYIPKKAPALARRQLQR